MITGSPIHMEAIRSSGAANTTFTLYEAGFTDAFTLTSSQIITITDVCLISTSGGAYTVVANTDAAGLRIVKGNADANGGIATNFTTSYTCPEGVVPVLIADDGEVSCIMRGYVSNA